MIRPVTGPLVLLLVCAAAPLIEDPTPLLCDKPPAPRRTEQIPTGS